MELFYIRHAQSRNNALMATDGKSNGRTEDPEVTDTGYEQISILSAAIRNIIYQPPGFKGREGGESEKNIVIYCSPMIRSILTAQPLARMLDIPLEMIVDLHECGGIYLDGVDGHPHGLPGKTKSYFQAEFPKVILPQEIDENGWWNREFENHPARYIRSQKFLKWILEKHVGITEKLILVGHLAFYNYFLSAVFHLGQDSNHIFHLNNTAITRMNISPPYYEILCMNSTRHIPERFFT